MPNFAHIHFPLGTVNPGSTMLGFRIMHPAHALCVKLVENRSEDFLFTSLQRSEVCPPSMSTSGSTTGPVRFLAQRGITSNACAFASNQHGLESVPPLRSRGATWRSVRPSESIQPDGPQPVKSRLFLSGMTAISFAPVSTLIPGMIPASGNNFDEGSASFFCWRIVRRKGSRH